MDPIAQADPTAPAHAPRGMFAAFRTMPLAPLLATLAVQTFATMALFSVPTAAPAIARDLAVPGSLIGIARESGLTQAAWAADEADFDAMVTQALSAPGPWVIGVRIGTDRPEATTERDPARIRDRFMRGIGTIR